LVKNLVYQYSLGLDMVLIIDEHDKIERLVLGSAFLGGGGGGDLWGAMELGKQLIGLGAIEIRSIEGLDPGSLIVTTSVVGPQSVDTHVRTSLLSNLVRSVRLLENVLGEPIDGLISSEIGAMNTISPFPASIILGIPVIDAPCNGRAHPTVLMGSMGLHRLPGYVSMLSASWGRVGTPYNGQVLIKGSLEEVLSVLRSIVAIRGSVATARNPVRADYVARNAAPGSISLALDIGGLISVYRYDPEDLSYRIAKRFSGTVIEDCVVVEKFSEIREGLDYGRVAVRCGDKELELVYANEYMYLESSGSVISVFPDLISTIDLSSGLPVISKDLSRGSRFNIVIISYRNLKLGSGVRYPESYDQVIKAIGRDIRAYLKELLVA